MAFVDVLDDGARGDELAAYRGVAEFAANWIAWNAAGSSVTTRLANEAVAGYIFEFLGTKPMSVDEAAVAMKTILDRYESLYSRVEQPGSSPGS